VPKEAPKVTEEVKEETKSAPQTTENQTTQTSQGVENKVVECSIL
jgi:hypothetical protein